MRRSCSPATSRPSAPSTWPKPTSASLPPGVRPPPVVPAPTLLAEARLVLEDRVELPRIYMAWHSPAMFAAGDAEMDLVGDLLANGKTSRLYRTLVYDQRIALDVSALPELARARQLLPARGDRRARAGR